MEGDVMMTLEMPETTELRGDLYKHYVLDIVHEEPYHNPQQGDTYTVSSVTLTILR